jgi:hypothetical protein
MEPPVCAGERLPCTIAHSTLGAASVSGRSHPIVCQTEAGSGSVTTIELFIGSQRRAWPGSRGVKPSVARIVTGARTIPCAVWSVPGLMPVTGVCS